MGFNPLFHPKDFLSAPRSFFFLWAISVSHPLYFFDILKWQRFSYPCIIARPMTITMFKNYSKCRIWIFKFLAVFVLLKVTCLVTLFDHKLQVFKKSHPTLQAKRATFTFWVDKSLSKMPKIILTSFWKPETIGQIVLPERSILIRQKLVENGKIQIGQFE